MEIRKLLDAIKFPVIFLMLVMLAASQFLPVFSFGISLTVLLFLYVFYLPTAIVLLLTMFAPLCSGYLMSKEKAGRLAAGASGALTIAIPSVAIAFYQTYLMSSFLQANPTISEPSGAPLWFTTMMFFGFAMLLALIDSTIGFLLGMLGNYIYHKKN